MFYTFLSNHCEIEYLCNDKTKIVAPAGAVVAEEGGKDMNLSAEELAKNCGLSYQEYLSLLEIKNKEVENDISIDVMDIEKETYETTSNIKLLTGIPDIDNLTKGLRTGVHVLAGFRKCCKSTLALNLIYRALNEGLNVCLLSLEMSKIDVLNTLVSLHSFEVSPKDSVSRDELQMLYELDRDSYNKYLYSFLSLPGNLIIYTEKDLEDNNNGPTYSESNLNSMFDKANECCYQKNGKEIQVLVVDNINCIRVWDKKTMGETATTSASNYFRKVALNFGTRIEDYEGNCYGASPVILLLLAQINRSGGKEALYNGFYPESAIAETVNIERDATTIIPIYTNQMYIESNVAFIKLEASRYSPAMIGPVDIPINLKYGKIGFPLEKVNADETKAQLLQKRTNYNIVEVKAPDGTVGKIVLPKGQPVPDGYKKVTSGSVFYLDDDEEY